VGRCVGRARGADRPRPDATTRRIRPLDRRVPAERVRTSRTPAFARLKKETHVGLVPPLAPIRPTPGRHKTAPRIRSPGHVTASVSNRTPCIPPSRRTRPMWVCADRWRVRQASTSEEENANARRLLERGADRPRSKTHLDFSSGRQARAVHRRLHACGRGSARC
jgi:hypothetical protein